MEPGGRRVLRPASELGPAYEATLDPAARRRGAYYTPEPVAAELMELTLGHWASTGHGGGRVPTICDPSCGGGAFLLAALDALVRRGVSASAAVGAVWGLDSDPGAVDVARNSISRWAAEHGDDPSAADQVARRQVTVGDGLLGDWPGAPFDVVVGNPPFQSQLRALTARDPAVRERVRELFGTAAVGYVDTAALFLLSALRHVADRGAICLIQPRSTAGAAHAAEVRRRIAGFGVVEIWWPQRRVFAAEVDVWAPIMSAVGPGRPHPDRGLADRLRSPGGWADVVAEQRGVPAVELPDGPVIADIATVSAGFRDEFYGLIPYVEEEAAAPSSGRQLVGRLVTVGAIEPLAATWGDVPVRFAGRRWHRPVVTSDALQDPVIGAWVSAQLRPKVLVATQTRWIEAVADPTGDLIGVTPAISVVIDVDPAATISAEHLAVALCSPVATLVAHRRHGGTALVADAVRLSATAVRSLPLPVDHAAWDRAVQQRRCSPGDWSEFGEIMCRAYAVDAEPALGWWLSLARTAGRSAPKPV